MYLGLLKLRRRERRSLGGFRVVCQAVVGLEARHYTYAIQKQRSHLATTPLGSRILILPNRGTVVQ